jgi:alkanesulfonate monooxygenase SsuD/methylene tetrahydromethanopterin reductase-like flavin-dependent oxidoreductase (luciferase family)
VRFAVNIPNFGDYSDAAAVADLAKLAEDSGWDGFFVWDHIVISDAMPVGDPFVILSAVACATSQLTIGTLVTPVPRRRPWVLARQCETLDRLSGGRFVLGIGIGFPPGPEFGTFGEVTDARTRGDMLDEGIDVLLGMWSAEPFSYAGNHYSVAETHFAPAPLQQPRIPIWVAATWPNPRPIRRAARLEGVYPLVDAGDGIDLITADGVADVVAAISAQRDGMEGYEVAAPLVMTGNAAADTKAAGELKAAGATFAQVGPPPGGSIGDVREWVAAGPPA